MEREWERSLSYTYITLDDIKDIFDKYNSYEEVVDYKLITNGKRNTNYIITTKCSKYILRICPKASEGYKSELISYYLLKDKINIPKVLMYSNIRDRMYIIYEYIEGKLLEDVHIDSRSIDIIARDMAIMHNISREEIRDINIIKYPPFRKWFSLFLKDSYARSRLGNERIDKLNYLSKDYEKVINGIDSYSGYIHSDFRPGNMIVTKDKSIYYVDWEFAHYGIRLMDIGQLFRYKEFFTESLEENFEKSYNKYSKMELPNDWGKLCRLVDLANPIQLLQGKHISKVKEQDLLKLVDDIISILI